MPLHTGPARFKITHYMKFKTTNSLSVSVSKKILTDGNLTPGAKGLFCFLLAIKPGYEMTKTEMRKFNKVGQQGLNSLIQELIDTGYLVEKDGEYLMDNGNAQRIQAVARKQEKAPRANKSKREWTDQRLIERREFVLLVQEEIKAMKPPVPSKELFSDFLRYWASLDSIDPSRKMKFQEKRPFNIKARLRTFMRMDKQRQEKQQKADRL